MKCFEQAAVPIPFGHPFPEQTASPNDLFDKHGTKASDLFVQRWVYRDQELSEFPDVRFDCVISIEGDEAKRSYNKQLRERSRKDTKRYRASDRYGIWLAKDFIPVKRCNEWVSGFGSGSNSVVLLHAFLNCQRLRLTANRGDIANTDPRIFSELKSWFEARLSEIDAELKKNGYFDIREWDREQKTEEQEKQDYSVRVGKVKKKVFRDFDGIKISEPLNEAEVFGLLVTIYSKRPDLIGFEIVDYNTHSGIDLLAKPKSGAVTDPDFAYIELKNRLGKKFNHGLKHLSWIVCWDIDFKDIENGSQMEGVNGDTAELDIDQIGDEKKYFLKQKGKQKRIEILCLKDLLRIKLGIDFD